MFKNTQVFFLSILRKLRYRDSRKLSLLLSLHQFR